MLATYKKLEDDGKIGPFEKLPDGRKIARAFAEYPKLVKTGRVDAKGKPVKKLVMDQREELAARAYGEIGDPLDPVVEEKNALAKEVARLQEQIAAMQQGQTGLRTEQVKADGFSTDEKQPVKADPSEQPDLPLSALSSKK